MIHKEEVIHNVAAEVKVDFSRRIAHGHDTNARGPLDRGGIYEETQQGKAKRQRGQSDVGEWEKCETTWTI